MSSTECKEIIECVSIMGRVALQNKIEEPNASRFFNNREVAFVPHLNKQTPNA